jgi:prophage maintenance system killer protein
LKSTKESKEIVKIKAEIYKNCPRVKVTRFKMMEIEENIEIKNTYRKINVPTQYRQAAKILQQINEGSSLKELVYNNKHIVRSN